MTSIGYTQIIQPVLASPQFDERQARRLLELLVKHEAASIDGYEEGLKYEYIALRGFMNGAVKDPRAAMLRIGELHKSTGKEFITDNEPLIRLFVDEMKEMPPARIEDVNTKVGRYFHDLAGLKDSAVSRWLENHPTPQQIEDGSFYSKVPAMLLPDIAILAAPEARIKVQVRAAQCLIAIKLWKYRNKKPAADLASMTTAAGLPHVPVDEYSRQPLRMALVDGEPVVYSIGKDGRDDGGRLDSDLDRKPGDHIYRLPATQQRKP